MPSPICCLECQSEFLTLKDLGQHVYSVHKMTASDYVIKHQYGGVQPVCMECSAETSYSKLKRDFNQYCNEHANLARSQWSKKHGFGEGVDPFINSGKTKENCDYMKRRSESMMGVGVKVFTDGEKVAALQKRLETEKERESRRFKKEKFDKYCELSKLRGYEVISTYEDVLGINHDIKFKCIVCGDDVVSTLSKICYTEKEKTVGCKNCTLMQIGDMNADRFRKTREDLLRDFEEIKEDLKLTVLTDCGEYKNKRQMLDVVCDVCGVVSKKSLGSMTVNKNKCYHCSKQGKSAWEKEVADCLIGYGVLIEEHVKIQKKEIDLLVEYQGKKLGIELNGLYWHSELEKHKDYHLNKYLLAKDNGIQLIQIFDDEWKYKKEQVVSIILSKLGIFNRTVRAKDCVVKQVEMKEANKFFDLNHLSGGVHTSVVAFGLYENNELVQAISFRKPFTSKYGINTYEIARFATLQNTKVEFGFSRLSKHSEDYLKTIGVETLVTYSDLRYGEGRVYESAGYVYQVRTKPDYFYTDFDKRYNRFKFRAQKGMTEKEFSALHKVVKVFGVGNNVFTKKI
jgi:hypothetical protein